MGFVQVRADIDGEERLSVLPESAVPHMPAWTPVDPDDVRPNPWDFEEPEPEDGSATPDVSDGPVEASDDAGAADDGQTAEPTTPEGPKPAPQPSRRQAATGDKTADTPKE